MRLRKGRSRIVLVFPSLGIAIKIPFIHFISGIHFLLLMAREGHLRWEWNRSMESMESSKELLFKGIADNWREYWFFIKSRNPFLLPSYFSFFGLFNIQQVGQVCTTESSVLWRQLVELTAGATSKSSHHFVNPENFCFVGKKLRILDYGSPRVQQVISKFGIKITNEFDPNYT